MRKSLPSGLYGITAEAFSKGRSNLEVAEAMIAGGVKIIQYREKPHKKSYRAIYEECRAMRALTAERGVLFVVNDLVDVAMMVQADGVHVGQDDLPIAEVRALVGPKMMIGLSTHSPAQATAAVEAGADYIGVGPIFATQTKEDVCAPVGLGYLEWVVAELQVPFVAIGGIKLHNLDQVLARGARSVCMVTELVGAPDVRARAEQMQARLTIQSLAS